MKVAPNIYQEVLAATHLTHGDHGGVLSGQPVDNHREKLLQEENKTHRQMLGHKRVEAPPLSMEKSLNEFDD